MNKPQLFYLIKKLLKKLLKKLDLLDYNPCINEV